MDKLTGIIFLQTSAEEAIRMTYFIFLNLVCHEDLKGGQSTIEGEASYD